MEYRLLYLKVNLQNIKTYVNKMHDEGENKTYYNNSANSKPLLLL